MEIGDKCTPPELLSCSFYWKEATVGIQLWSFHLISRFLPRFGDSRSFIEHFSLCDHGRKDVLSVCGEPLKNRD